MSFPIKMPFGMGRSGPPFNTWFFGPTQVHIPNGISIGSAVFAGPPNMDSSIVFVRWRQCAPHVTHASLGPPESSTQTASRSVQPFFHSSRQSVPIPYLGRTFSLKIAHCHGDLDLLLRHFLGPSEPKTQTASRLVQPFWHSDRQN